MKRYYLAQAEHFLNPGEQSVFQLNAVMREMGKLNRPKKFSPGEGNVRKEHLATFESQCAMIEEHFGVRHREMTLFEFASRLETLKQKFKKD